ncbi:competence protein CoiA [Periweissella fabalis]|uniref:Competence protein CoiA n=1 Tax=Periweissella fabalis TaxID=1070421 RepID=A0A7X6N1L4_9LACO|nr:competence protein CoiA family protein [Periweissella fabalis]MCM0598542.1 hypothetical protein [Periweissella fabalis]NKZ24176.1 hypothetical protein [Periweissella fabalis]
MLYALVGKKLIRADEYVDNKQAFRCTGCGDAVRLRHGSVNIAHFAHINKQCVFENEAESYEHLLGKLQLYQISKIIGQAQVEVTFPSIKQRADIVLKYKQQKLILEYQCSPISIEQVKKRTQAYQTLGYKVIWLLGPKYAQNKITKKLLTKFNMPLLNFYNTKTQKITIRYNFNVIDFQSIKSATRELDLQRLLEVVNVSKNKLIWQDIVVSDDLLKQQGFKIQQLLVRKNLEWLKIQQECYQQNHNLGGIPWICHPKRSMPVALNMSHILWRCQCILFLEKYTIESIITTASLQQIFIAIGRWLDVDSRFIKYVVNQFIIELVTNKFLISISKGVLMLNSHPTWYQNWQVKTNSLKLN